MLCTSSQPEPSTQPPCTRTTFNPFVFFTARRSRNQRVRRSCLRRMWLFKDTHLWKKEQERRAAVYREASRRHCWGAVWVRPPGHAWHAALDRVRGGDEPVPLEQPGSA